MFYRWTAELVNAAVEGFCESAHTSGQNARLSICRYQQTGRPFCDPPLHAEVLGGVSPGSCYALLLVTPSGSWLSTLPSMSGVAPIQADGRTFNEDR